MSLTSHEYRFQIYKISLMMTVSAKTCSQNFYIYTQILNILKEKTHENCLILIK